MTRERCIVYRTTCADRKVGDYIKAAGLTLILSIIFVTGFAQTGLLEMTATVSEYFCESTTFNISCNGADDGTIDISVTGGTPPYSYSWTIDGSPFPANMPGLFGLSPGEYCVEVTDDEGDVVGDCFVLTEPNPLEINLLGTFCADLCVPEGFIEIRTIGGCPPYSFFWTRNGVPFSTDESLYNLVIDITEGQVEYCVEVIDANGCVVTECIDCGPLRITDVSIAEGRYSNTCSESLYFTSCGTGSGASIYANAAGFGEIDIAWSGPDGFTSGLPEIFAENPGIYCVTISVPACADTVILDTCFDLTAPPPLFITDAFTFVQTSCDTTVSCDSALSGVIAVLVEGGNPCDTLEAGYFYEWSGPDGFTANNTSFIEITRTGEYCVIITDADGCTIDTCITVIPPPAAELQITDTVFSLYPCYFNVSCPSARDGFIDITVDGGCPPYSFEWKDEYGTVVSTEEDLDSIGTGEYCVTVTDATGCRVLQECYALITNTDIRLTDLSITEGNCAPCPCTPINSCGTGDGIFLLAEFDPLICLPVWEWTLDGEFLTNEAGILATVGGTYCLTVSDPGGCFTEMVCRTYTATPPIVIDSAIVSNFNCGSNISCADANNGSIELVVSGGNPCDLISASGYHYSWTGPGDYTANTASIDNLAPGEYCVTITDSDDCTADTCIFITGPDPFLCIIETPGSNINCDAPNNALSATVTGGCLPYSYSWSVSSSDAGNWAINGDTNMATVEYTSGSAGDVATFSLTVTDNNGCEATCEIVLICVGSEYCTHGQGFYGNQGGRHCDHSTTIELLTELMGNGDIILGDALLGNSMTFTSNDVECIIDRLPGGGPPKALNGNGTCTDPASAGVAIQNNNDRFRNVLLSHTLTLALNLRMDPSLAGLTIDNNYLVTLESDGCGGTSGNIPISGTGETTEFPASAIGLTVADIFTLANEGLAGTIPNNELRHIALAVGLINDAFDGCRFIGGWYSQFPPPFPPDPGTIPGTEDPERNDTTSLRTPVINAHPNPANTSVRLVFRVPEDCKAIIDIIDHNGMVIIVPFNGDAFAGSDYEVELDLSSLRPGIYFYRLTACDQLSIKKLVIVR